MGNNPTYNYGTPTSIRSMYLDMSTYELLLQICPLNCASKQLVTFLVPSTLVGGLEHFSIFPYIGIVVPTDCYFSFISETTHEFWTYQVFRLRSPLRFCPFPASDGRAEDQCPLGFQIWHPWSIWSLGISEVAAVSLADLVPSLILFHAHWTWAGWWFGTFFSIYWE